MALAVLAFCTIALPIAISDDKTGFYRPILLGMYVPTIPFLIGLFQAFRLLTNIDQNKAFSISSINSLKDIKYCAIIISILYALSMPYIVHVADKDDAPGAVAIGLVIVFASIVVAVFAAVLQKLLQNGMEIKSENDLTV